MRNSNKSEACDGSLSPQRRRHHTRCNGVLLFYARALHTLKSSAWLLALMAGSTTEEPALRKSRGTRCRQAAASHWQAPSVTDSTPRLGAPRFHVRHMGQVFLI